MTLSTAHRLIAALQSDPDLRTRMPSPEAQDGLDVLLGIARTLEYEVSVEDMRVAYRQHWALRALAKSGGDGNRESSAAASAEKL